jgi:hypothetical protein
VSFIGWKKTKPKREICMNHTLFVELLRKLKSNPQLKRKFKIFLGFGLAGTLLVGAFVVWAGIATFKSVANIGANPTVQEKVTKLETEIQNLPALAKVDCWTTVQSLLDFQVWFEKPISENINNITTACFGKKSIP